MAGADVLMHAVVETAEVVGEAAVRKSGRTFENSARMMHRTFIRSGLTVAECGVAEALASAICIGARRRV